MEGRQGQDRRYGLIYLSSLPLKGSPAFRGIWKRGVRGDFGRICLVNYGLINKARILESFERLVYQPFFALEDLTFILHVAIF